MASNGASLFESGEGVLTHCNTGGLATVGVGTALGVIRRAFEQGKKLHIYVDETRPLLQGARLTAWELQRLKIPFTLICDNMAASLMRQGFVQKAITGADRIALNGDFANKIGTYSVAVNAHHHGIPFFVAAPMTTVDLRCESGADIPIEERAAEEVRGGAAKDCAVYNPAFDVTPAKLVGGYVLDKGFFKTAHDLKSFF
jgi:methylthioribose-1-phosphate isomerase